MRHIIILILLALASNACASDNNLVQSNQQYAESTGKGNVNQISYNLVIIAGSGGQFSQTNELSAYARDGTINQILGCTVVTIGLLNAANEESTLQATNNLGDIVSQAQLKRTVLFGRSQLLSHLGLEALAGAISTIEAGMKSDAAAGGPDHQGLLGEHATEDAFVGILEPSAGNDISNTSPMSSRKALNEP